MGSDTSASASTDARTNVSTDASASESTDAKINASTESRTSEKKYVKDDNGDVKGIIALLDHLKEEDRLFEYHITKGYHPNQGLPPSQRKEFGDSFVDYLTSVYSAPGFIVEEAWAVQKYIQIGDMVRSKVTYVSKEVHLASNTLVKIVEWDDNKGVSKEDTARVIAKKKTPHSSVCQVALEDLVVIAELRPWPLSPITHKHGIRAAQYLQTHGQKKRVIADYIGKEIATIYGAVPKGIGGMVVNNFAWDGRGNELHIIWENCSQVIQTTWSVERKYTAPNRFWTYREVALIIPNDINIQELKEEHLKLESE